MMILVEEGLSTRLGTLIALKPKQFPPTLRNVQLSRALYRHYINGLLSSQSSPQYLS